VITLIGEDAPMLWQITASAPTRQTLPPGKRSHQANTTTTDYLLIPNTSTAFGWWLLTGCGLDFK